MMMLKTPGLLAIVALEMLLYDPGCSDVIVTIKVRSNTVRDIIFPAEYFRRFYNCMCDNHETCTAEYWIKAYRPFQFRLEVQNVIERRRVNDASGETSVYYHCGKGDSLEILCTKASNSDVENNYDVLYASASQCFYSCVYLIWSYDREDIDLRNNELNLQHCNDDCMCSRTSTVAIISAEVTSTAKATTSKATTTIALSLPTTTTSPPSTSTAKFALTPTSSAPNFANDDSNDTPELGLIIGVVIAVIFIAIIIVVIGIFVRRRKRRQNTSKPHNGALNSTVINDFNNARSTIENRYTDRQSNSPYSVASSASNYSNLNANDAINDPEYAKALSKNSGSEAKSTSAISVTSSKKDQESFSENYLKSIKSPCGLPSFPAKGHKDIEMAASEDGEYGYSTAHDQGLRTGDSETAFVSQYEYAKGVDPRKKDNGYESPGPENTFDTDANKKADHPNNKDGSAYSVAGNINSSTTGSSTNQPKGIYSTLHDENRQIQNPYNTLLQPNKDADDSHDATSSSTDQSKGIYSRLHEDKRQIQNPYNTLPQPTDDPAATDPMSSPAHNSKKASQNARYSFAQPTFNEGSNEKANNNKDLNDVARSQNHTYHVLEGGKEDGDKSDVKRNIYFELEKQEGVSD